MGTDKAENGSYCEWIELHNRGESSVSLSGWTLTFGSATVALPESATISPDGFFVIERFTENACPDPVPGSNDVSVSFGSGLSNAGTTITLLRTDGSIEDQVAGGTDWENIGGDNQTKHTPQYAEAGWVTNEPTPGAPNHSESVAPATSPSTESNEESNNSSNTSGKSSSQTTRTTRGGEEEETVTLTFPEPNLSLTLTIPTRAHVNLPLTFTVEPKGISKKLLASVAMEWNFGDTHVAVGREVTHTYAYPGEYALVVRGTFADHEEIVMRKIVVLPVTFSLSYTDTGALQIHNDAAYEIDLSGYTLVSGARIVFPPRTILLPRATLTIAPQQLAYSRARALLYDTSMQLVATSDERPSEAVHTAPPHVPSASVTREADDIEEDISTKTSSFIFGTEAHAEEAGTQEDVVVQQQPRIQPDEVPVSNRVPEGAMPYLGLITVLTLGVGALWWGRREV